jgi:RNA polymerase sigma factor for flagellar operon FliA
VSVSASNSTASFATTLDVVDAALGSIERRLPPHVSRDDLASAGKLALVEALLNFNGSAEDARAYCFVRVRGAMLDELRRLDPLSRHTRSQISAVRKAASTLEREFGRTPSQAELSAATGLSKASLVQLDRLASAADVCSADATDADGEAVHVLVEVDQPCPARAAETEDTHAAIHSALKRLPTNHAHVLRRYYLDDVTLEVIATELSVSKERVRQLREAAEKKLREDFIVLALWQSVMLHR